MEILHKRIKDLRLQNKYSQEKVAEYLGIDRSNYSKYERGKLELKPDMIKKLAILYKVTADYLLGLEDI